ncbi:MAG: type I restriction enzyme HsdR N-terminal domain-containing protein [Bacteroidia bacterium]|nr:type I restriction enzyme HsdR N-terminal domain-containing protein [Bacteroidia bacterium]
MQALNFRPYSFRFKNKENKPLIFDEIRKKFVALQPEEWVRQHVLHFLLYDKGYPKNRIQVEKQIKVNSLTKRFDIIVYQPDGNIEVLVECKSPSTPISQDVFDQIARYNRRLKAKLLIITNGLDHYFFRVDTENEKYDFIQDIPDLSL